MRLTDRQTLGLVGALLASATALVISIVGSGASSEPTPIQHIVVIDQENHTFNNVLGWLCLRDPQRHCLGTNTGQLPNGQRIDLAPASDVVVGGAHAAADQTTAVDNGRMDGFAHLEGCWRTSNCYNRYAPSQIPSLARLARTFAISDHTFEGAPVQSWGSHLDLVAGQMDGFLGDNPRPVHGNPAGPGWGCDSYRDALWRPSPTSAYLSVPSCVPQQDGSGPYRPSPVQWVPTIMDRLDAAGLTWKIYSAQSSSDRNLDYGWAICPTFADCIDTSQVRNSVPSANAILDARAGTLPSFSIVTPSAENSQHNTFSMVRGDDWIGSVVNAVMSGPDWSSTAVFITYDDFGGFYDEVAPPLGMGIRVPMVIVSPYAKPAYTDSNVASFASILAFTEHAFSLKPLGTADATAYDYINAFDFSQSPLPPVALGSHPVPASSRAWIKAHPAPANDPT